MKEEVINLHSIDQKIDKLEADPPIAIDSVDYTIHQKERVVSELDHVFRYFGRVEGEVALYSKQLSVLLPHADEPTKRFINIWNDQELKHGAIFDEIQNQLGLQPATIDPNKIGSTVVIGGEIGKIPKVHDILMMLYLSRGAMHEKLTFSGYKLLEEKISFLGEKALIETAIKPIKRQEAAHLGYYQLAAINMRQRLSPWQLRTTQYLTKKSYRPVGVSDHQQGLDFGQIATTLAGDNIIDLVDPVQKLGNKLLNNTERPKRRNLGKIALGSMLNNIKSEPSYVMEAVMSLI